MSIQSDIFADAREREDRLFDAFPAAPVVEITGVVGATGPAGSKFAGQSLWTMGFQLSAWRINSGVIQRQPLKIQRRMTHEEMQELKAQIQHETVIRIKARVIDDAQFGGPHGLFEAFMGVEKKDAELNAHLVQLLKPVIYTDNLLGAFTLDRRIDTYYSSDAEWIGRKVECSLTKDKAGNIGPALATAHALWKNQHDWHRRIFDYAAKVLLAPKNESWLEEEEAPLTAEQFQGKMSVDTISVGPNGNFDFWCNDGNLFLGHSIVIAGTLTNGPNDAQICG